MLKRGDDAKGKVFSWDSFLKHTPVMTLLEKGARKPSCEIIK